MPWVLNRYQDCIYASVRIVSGLLFACHGAQKLFGVFGGGARATNPVMLVAGIVEFFGGVLIAVGLFIASGQMAVAYFRAHAPQGFWPIMNRSELAVLYCFLFLYISARGSGVFNVDHLIHRRPAATPMPPQ